MSSYTPEHLHERLTSAFESDKVVVKDTSDGCGGKFIVYIGSDKFNNVALLDRHRMVHSALEEEMKTIHALQIKAYTLEQWAKKM